MNATSNPRAAADEARKNYREMTSPEARCPEQCRALTTMPEAELFPLMRGKFTKRPDG